MYMVHYVDMLKRNNPVRHWIVFHIIKYRPYLTSITMRGSWGGGGGLNPSPWNLEFIRFTKEIIENLPWNHTLNHTPSKHNYPSDPTPRTKFLNTRMYGGINLLSTCKINFIFQYASKVAFILLLSTERLNCWTILKHVMKSVIRIILPLVCKLFLCKVDQHIKW